MKALLTLPSPIHSSALLVTALLVAGCGGGGSNGGSGQGAGNGQPAGPDADIAFPPAHVETSEDLIFVRGTTSNHGQVASVWVNAFLAQSADGWATWEAAVPLGPGETVLVTTIVTTDGEEIQDPDQQTVLMRETQIGDPVDLAYSSGQGPVIWYLDDSQVLSHDLLNNQIEPVSGPTAGFGPDLEDPIALTADPDGEHVYVLDRAAGGDQVLRIKTSTGMRSRLDNPMPGEELDRCTDLAFLEWEIQGQPVSFLYVATANHDTIYFVDPATGDMDMTDIGLNAPVGIDAIDVSVVGGSLEIAMLDTSDRLLVYNGIDMEPIASHGDGRGDMWTWGTDVQIMPNGNILVTDRHSGDVFHVDTWNGQRTTLDQAIGAHGMSFQDLCAIESFEYDGQTAMVAMDKGLDLCAGIADGDGEWEVVMDTRFGEGSSMNVALDLTPIGDDFIATSALPGEVVRIDPQTGSRTPLANWDDLPLAHIPTAICTDGAGNVAYFTEALMGSITAMDLHSGMMATLTGQGIGQGPGFQILDEVGLACDDAGQRLMVMVDAKLVAVDLETGDRTILSGPGVGQGPDLGEARAITLDLDRDRALVAGGTAVYAVDLSTGDRQVLSSLFVGGGPDLEDVTSLAYSPAAGELLVANQLGRSLLRIDEATGNRSEALAGGQSGPAAANGVGLQWDTEDQMAYMLDMRRGSLKVLDLTRGQWMTVSR